MKVALDTNFLAYAEGVNGAAERDHAVDLLSRLPVAAVVLPVQVLGELYSVLTRKTGASRPVARAAVQTWRDAYQLAETNAAVLDGALELATRHKLSFWDAVILGASADAGCGMLLSEDLHAGFAWRGAIVINPMLATPDARLARLLA